MAEPLVNLIFRLGGLYNFQPISGRSSGVLASNNIYSISIVKYILNGHQLIVNLGPHHLISYSGVDGISKVDRGGARRKILHISCGSKAVHAFIEEGKVGLYHLHKFFGVGLILLPLQNFAEPLHFRHLILSGLILRASLFFIFPVGGNTELRGSMHFKGTNLDFKGHSVLSDYRSMKGLVHIGLRHGDIVLKAPGDGGVKLMNKAQHRITVLHRIHDNTDGKQIIDLVYGFVLIDHLLVNGEEMLDSSLDIGPDAGLFDMLPHFLHNLVDSLFPNLSFKMHLLRQIVINFRLQVFQGKVVHLNLNLADTQTIR